LQVCVSPNFVDDGRRGTLAFCLAVLIDYRQFILALSTR